MLRQRDGSTGVVKGRVRSRAGRSHDTEARNVKQCSNEHVKIAMGVLKGWLGTLEALGVGLVACLARTCRNSTGGLEIRAARAPLDLGKLRKRHQDSTPRSPSNVAPAASA